jgi:hypothetical protein
MFCLSISSRFSLVIVRIISSLKAGIVGLNPTQGIDVCVRLFCLCCSVYRYWPCEGLISRPRSPTDCVYDEETEKAAKAQQLVVEPY